MLKFGRVGGGLELTIRRALYDVVLIRLTYRQVFINTVCIALRPLSEDQSGALSYGMS